jgi:hypothetical protein
MAWTALKAPNTRHFLPTAKWFGLQTTTKIANNTSQISALKTTPQLMTQADIRNVQLLHSQHKGQTCWCKKYEIIHNFRG